MNDRWPGAHWEDIKYTCIASKGVAGEVKLNLDSILGYTSYFALIGEGGVEGGGITPVKAALLQGAESVVFDDVYHDMVIIY